MFIGFLPVSKLPETMQMRGPLSKPEITYGYSNEKINIILSSRIPRATEDNNLM